MVEIATQPPLTEIERDITLEVTEESGGGAEFLVVRMSGPDGSPVTFGTRGLQQLHRTIEALGNAHDLSAKAAVIFTGTASAFAAGADLKVAAAISDHHSALALGELGHQTFSAIAQLPLPTIALISGVAAGGGLELALHCDYRVGLGAAGPLSLPEASLGIIPGWGGTFLLPHLIGIEAALEVALWRPARNKRGVSGRSALEIGLIDHLIDEPSNALDDIGQWLTKMEVSSPKGSRSENANLAPNQQWLLAITRARERLRSQNASPASARTLVDLFEIANRRDRDLSRRMEVRALARGLISSEFKAALRSQELLRRAGRHHSHLAAESHQPQQVSIMGAGLMAVQLGFAIAKSGSARVYLRDINDDRVSAALTHLSSLLAEARQRGLSCDAASNIKSRISFGTDAGPIEVSELVIEAVSEDITIKRAVLREIETLVNDEAIIATNTSALSITEMATELRHPERFVGIHFFNPIERMPLVEIVHSPVTSIQAVSSATAFAASLGKITVQVRDAPGFVVNRILLRYLSEVLISAEAGASAATVSAVSRDLLLPMNPLALIDLVGATVTNEVLLTLQRTLGERFHASTPLQLIADENRRFYATSGDSMKPDETTLALFGKPTDSQDPEAVSLQIRLALADEITRMLDESVVDSVEVIDLAMLLGAGWHLQRGGITPYLIETGLLES